MVNFEYTVTKLSEVFSVRDTDVLKVQVGTDDTVEVKGSIDRMNFEPLTPDTRFAILAMRVG